MVDHWMKYYYESSSRLKFFVDFDKEFQYQRNMKKTGSYRKKENQEDIGEIFHEDFQEYSTIFFDQVW